jgi:GNAT superfamily N-acetyltransferase
MISIRSSSYTEWLAEAGLIAEYAAECSIPAIGEINPQAETYAAMENIGIMHSFAAFYGERMVGFATVLTPVMPHYSKRVATIESLFVARESRRSGAGHELMRAVEGYAEQSGCVGILYSSPAGGQLERLLETSKHYQRTNAVFFRRFI